MSAVIAANFRKTIAVHCKFFLVVGLTAPIVDHRQAEVAAKR
jgi:hypothetical protein